MLRTITSIPRHLAPRARFFSTSPTYSSSLFGGPAPPRLPKEEQELFEKLQKQSTGAFSQPKESPSEENPTPTSTPNLRMQINQSPDSAASSESEPIRFENGKEIKKGEEFHPNMRRGAPPEFEGEVNPKTGEVGGPKNEPLRWGSGEGRGDWSYNGRVTDF